MSPEGVRQAKERMKAVRQARALVAAQRDDRERLIVAEIASLLLRTAEKRSGSPACDASSRRSPRSASRTDNSATRFRPL